MEKLCAEVSVPHPGTVLQRKFTALKARPASVARHLGLSRQTLYEIFSGNQSITPRVAIRIAKLTGTAPEMWLGLQLEYDLAVARLTEREFLKNMQVLDEFW